MVININDLKIKLLYYALTIIHIEQHLVVL